MGKKKRVRIEDIAHACGVSRATVSVALSGRMDMRISEETRSMVRSKAEALGYVYSSGGRGGPPGRRTLLFLHGDLSSGHVGTSFFVRVAQELRALGPSRGFMVIEAAPPVEEQSDGLMVRRLVADFRPVACVTHNILYAAAAKAADPELPVLLLQGSGGEANHWDASYIVDDRRVGELAAAALASGGRRRAVLFFPETGTHRCPRERLEGFRDAFQRADGSLELCTLPSLVPHRVEAYLTEWIARAKAAAAAFDAAYCYSDSVALVCLRTLQRSGFRVPADMAVIGTDNLFWGAFSLPSLTTMELNEGLFALRIADDLDAALRGSPWSRMTIRIPVSLIKRESA